MLESLIKRTLERLFPQYADGTCDVNLAREAADEVFYRVKDIAGVEGVGVSASPKGYTVKVNLSSPLAKEDSKAIPKRVKDVPVKTQLTGQVMVL